MDRRRLGSRSGGGRRGEVGEVGHVYVSIAGWNGMGDQGVRLGTHT